MVGEKVTKTLERLKQIKINELSEREFFHQIIEIIRDLGEIRLTVDEQQQLSSALKEIGCVEFETWKQHKEEKGETVEMLRIQDAVERGDLGAAESFISLLLFSYDRANYSLGKMNEGLTSKWLEKSEEILKDERDEKVSKEKIPSWIERGKDIIYPERFADWEECVRFRVADLNHGVDLEDTLKIMEELEKGASLEEVNKIFEEQNYSPSIIYMIRSAICHFSKRGPEFYEYTADDELQPGEKKFIEEKKRENSKLEELHYKDERSKLIQKMMGQRETIASQAEQIAYLQQQLADLQKQTDRSSQSRD